MIEKKGNKPNYGYYGLISFHIFISLVIFLGIAISIFFSKAAGIIVIFMSLWSLIGYWILMHFNKQNESYNLTNIISLKGSENVLDVGCGLGKATIGVAKLLKGGKVTGIDIWNKIQIAKSSPDNAYKNAEIEGVINDVEFKTGNALNIPYSNESFDLVVASGLLTSFRGNKYKLIFLSEVYRVLCPGGKFLLIELLRNIKTNLIFPISNFLSKKKCEKLLKQAGFTNISFKFKSMRGHFLAEKPISENRANSGAYNKAVEKPWPGRNAGIRGSAGAALNFTLEKNHEIRGQ